MTVDQLLKKEFDRHRAEGSIHPVVKNLGFDFVPLRHPKMDDWRSTKKGVERTHQATGFDIFGAVDDIWVDSDGKAIVVDYKATAKDAPVTTLGNQGFHNSYRRQLDIYSWLLRGQPDIEVSAKAFWLYVTGRKSASDFGGMLVFDPALIEYHPDVSWIEPFLEKVAGYAASASPPAPGADCEQCTYRERVNDCLK